MLKTLDIEALLTDAAPPDSDFFDLIEWAFLEGQIDGQKADLAYYLSRAMARLKKLIYDG